MKRAYANYQVSLKLLLWKGGNVLYLKDVDGKWDLPGGRIDTIESKTPLENILAREVREELGKKLKYELLTFPN
jgi:8-oxo-dGTP pyrophosphatase MutT (NUDIX family)